MFIALHSSHCRPGLVNDNEARAWPEELTEQWK